MSNIPTVSEFLQIVQPNSSGNQSIIKFATVISLFADGSAKIQFDGEDTISQKKYPSLATYTAAIGDRIIIIATSGSYVILGKIKY